MQSSRLWKRQKLAARTIVCGKLNSQGQGQVQMDRSRAKGKNKGVAACQGNRGIVRTKATIINRTKAKKNQAQAIA